MWFICGWYKFIAFNVRGVWVWHSSRFIINYNWFVFPYKVFGPQKLALSRYLSTMYLSILMTVSLLQLITNRVRISHSVWKLLIWLICTIKSMLVAEELGTYRLTSMLLHLTSWFLLTFWNGGVLIVLDIWRHIFLCFIDHRLGHTDLLSGLGSIVGHNYVLLVHVGNFGLEHVVSVIFKEVHVLDVNLDLLLGLLLSILLYRIPFWTKVYYICLI